MGSYRKFIQLLIGILSRILRERKLKIISLTLFLLSFRRWMFMLVASETSYLIIEFPHPEFLFENESQLYFDVYIPNLKLAFEYQGVQHFVPSFYGEVKHQK